MGEAPGGVRVGRERVGGSDPVPHGLGDPFEPDECGVGIGREREGRRHHGEHVGQHLAEPRGGCDQALQRLVGARRLREPEPGEELLGGLSIVARRGLDRSGEGFEERPVEQPLVDPPDQLRRPVVLGLEVVGAGEAERPRQRGARVPVGREVVGLEVAHHLEPVLQAAQEPVGVGEGLGVLVRDVALVGEHGERPEGVGLAQALVAAAVDDLEELDRELDVADAAAAALHLGELLAAAPDVLLEADLRAPDVVDRGLVQVARVDRAGDAVDEGGAEGCVARGRARLDHRLALPGGGLAFVVGEGGVERARERSGAAARTETEVDPERDALGGRVGEVGDHVGGRGLGAVTAHLLEMQQEEVDVARVVQLAPAELAQRDDRVPVGAGEGEAGVGHVADLGDDLLVGRAAEVAGGDPEHRPLPEPPDAGAGAVRRDVPAELGPEGLPAARGDVRQRLDLLGMADEQVARRGREPEQPRGDRQDLGAAQELTRSGVVAHPRERDARELRIGRLRERPAEDLGRQHRGMVARQVPAAGHHTALRRVCST